MGELSPVLKESYLKKMGLQAWKRKKLLIQAYWNQVSDCVNNLNLPFTKTKIYQDGLPYSEDGNEIELVEKMAASGSLNHILVKKLITRGATLVGTESPDLLIKEYNIAIQSIESQISPDQDIDIKNQGEQILKQRDEFIAKRISETLNPGEVGVLFIGMLHNVIPLLDKDIEVEIPIAPVV